jgi:hypothetical protein
MTAVTRSAEWAPARRARPIGDGALAAVLAAVLPVITYFAAKHQPGHRPFDAGTIALVVASAGVVARRRRHLVAVLALVFGISLVYFTLGYADGIPQLVGHGSWPRGHWCQQ